MAASNSDDNSAPVDFQISSTIGDGDSKYSSLHEKCPLCKNLKKVFYCVECVKNGDFVSSSSKYPERFADKKLHYLKLKSEQNIIHNKCLRLIQKKALKNELELEINLYKERIKLVNQLIKELIQKKEHYLTDIECVRERNKNYKIRLPRYKERVDKIELYYQNDMCKKIIKERYDLQVIQEILRRLKQKHIKDLLSYVFPITKINTPKNVDEEESEESDTICELAEATRTSYIRGKWIYLDLNLESRFKIIAPTLPENGDYSAYINWIESHQDGVLDSEDIEKNQAYNIGAALCYTAQLVNLLAFYLDILLPKKISYSDFCNIEMNETRFYNKVLKLNLNILYLCMSQKIDNRLLNPSHTLSNILQLINDRLGVVEPFEIDSSLMLSLENKFEIETKDDNESNVDKDDGDDEEQDMFPLEWEAIPLVACPESSPGPASNSQMGTLQATTSVTGGLVNSVTSFFRGWTGR